VDRGAAETGQCDDGVAVKQCAGVEGNRRLAFDELKASFAPTIAQWSAVVYRCVVLVNR
jgi:hypothetical protein